MSYRSPLILAIESSGAACGVGLSESDIIISEKVIYENNMHDKMLAELIRLILSDNNIKVSDLDAVAVSSGPGSFTGLRIGAAMAKGICYDNSPKLIAVPTLYSLAFAAREEAENLKCELIIPIINSHKDYTWHQIFSVEAVPISEIRYMERNEILIDTKIRALYCGPGAIGKNSGNISKSVRVLSPGYISSLGYKLYIESKFISVDDFVPNYHNIFTPKKITR